MDSNGTPDAAGKRLSPTISRRHLMQLLSGGWLLITAGGRCGLAAANDKPRRRFHFEVVKELAHNLAQRPYQKPAPLPQVLRRLTYDQYRLIAFRNDRALWREPRLPF